MLFSAILSLFFTGWGLQRAPLRNWDEAWHAKIVLDMSQAGEWWLYLNDGRPDPLVYKPPLVFWAMRASVHVLGPTELAFRVWSAIAFVILVVYVTRFVAIDFGRRAALWVAVLLATHPLFLFKHCAREGNMDAPLLLFVTVAALGVWRWTQGKSAPWAVPAASLALMTKGFAACVVLMPLLGFMVMRRGLRGSVKPLIGMMTAFFPLIAWWLICESKSPGFIRKALTVDLLGRIDGTTGISIAGPWVHVEKFVIAFAPAWIGLMIAAVLLRGTSVKAHFVSFVRRRKEAVIYWGVWCIVPLALLSISKTRYVWYAYPAHIPGVILLGVALGKAFGFLRRSCDRRLSNAGRVIAACLVLSMFAPPGWKTLHYSRTDQVIAAELEELVATLRSASGVRLSYLNPHADPRSAVCLARAGIRYEPVRLEGDPRRLPIREIPAGSLVLAKSDLMSAWIQAAAEQGIQVSPVVDLPQSEMILSRRATDY